MTALDPSTPQLASAMAAVTYKRNKDGNHRFMIPHITICSGGLDGVLHKGTVLIKCNDGQALIRAQSCTEVDLMAEKDVSSSLKHLDGRRDSNNLQINGEWSQPGTRPEDACESSKE